jgi:acetyl-CoA carboxylase carboxyltransferase component
VRPWRADELPLLFARPGLTAENAGNYGMCGRAYDPRFRFTWPNHRIAVTGPEQLAGVMSIVRRGAAERAGQAYDEPRSRRARPH